MFLRYLCILWVALFFWNPCFSQTLKISGSVKDNKFQILPSATIQLKDSQKLNIIAYSFTDGDGKYSLSAKLSVDEKLFLIAGYLGFKKDTIIIAPSDLLNQSIVHNFILTPDENQLNEVSITAPKPAIHVDNDTTKYNVQSFTSPEDRNLEAVIRKMPGMEVSKDGTIFYKQKKISKILLENDDLTGENYKTITQNLKPEMVDEVQAVEHWVEDDLLKGIINSDDIILNLSLKDKRKKKMIGNVDIAYGTDNRNDLSSNLIAFSAKTKAYAFVRQNNIGSSQEDLFKMAGENRRLVADGKLINHQILTFNPFDANAVALNNSLSGSVSSVTRFNSRLKMSTAIYGMRNRLYGYDTTTSLYYEPINAVTVNAQDQESDNKHYQADLNLDYLTRKNARFTTKLIYKLRPQQFNALAFSSFNDVVSNRVDQRQTDRLQNYGADLKYTVKANSTSAIIVSARLTNDQVDQRYNPISALYQTAGIFNGAESLLQTANTNNLLVKFDVQGLKKNGKHYFYANLGGESIQNTLKSNLFNEVSADSVPGFINDNDLTFSKAYLAAKYTYDNKKIILQSFVRASFIGQTGLGTDTSFLAFEPEFKLTLKLTSFQTAVVKYNYLNTLGSPLDYYSNPVLTDLRSISTGLSRFYNFGTHNFDVSYSNNELNDKYFSFNLNGNGQLSDGGFLISNFFENTLYYSQKQSYRGMKSLSAGAGLQKFLPSISSSITANYNSSVNSYYGRVVDEINKYTALAHVLNFRGSTGFKLPVNFTLEFQYQNIRTHLERTTINNQRNFKYSLQSRYQVAKSVFNLIDFNVYKINGQTYKLLHAEVQYNPNKGRFKYAVFGKNLLNISSISNSFVSNVSETFSNTSILGRYVLGSISMSIK